MLNSQVILSVVDSPPCISVYTEITVNYCRTVPEI